MEADECDCIRCAPQGNGGNVCHHDEVLGHKVDLEQVLHHTKQHPYVKYSNKELIQILEQGRNLNDYLRAELIERLARLADLCDE